MSDGGKGSKPRPFSVDYKTFSNNWDAIFKNKKNESCKDCGIDLPNKCSCENQISPKPQTNH